MLFALIAIVIGMALSGCGSSAKTTPPVTKQQQQANNATGLNTFTLDELKKYDGQNGNPAYAAVDGKVYDVTNAAQWKNGMHKGYKAGRDLTKEIKVSPVLCYSCCFLCLSQVHKSA